MNHEKALEQPEVELGKTLSEEESRELLHDLQRQLAVLMSEEDTKKSGKRRSPDVDILFSRGTFQQQIETQMALLTQAVASCDTAQATTRKAGNCASAPSRTALAHLVARKFPRRGI